jgi:hypothetical protein
MGEDDLRQAKFHWVLGDDGGIACSWCGNACVEMVWILGRGGPEEVGRLIQVPEEKPYR